MHFQAFFVREALPVSFAIEFCVHWISFNDKIRFIWSTTQFLSNFKRPVKWVVFKTYVVLEIRDNPRADVIIYVKYNSFLSNLFHYRYQET